MRTKLVTVLIALVIVALNVPTAGATTENEADGCRKDQYNFSYEYTLQFKGEYDKKVGYLLIKRRVSPSDSDNWRWCAMTKFGGETRGKKHRAMIRIGSRDKGSTSNPVTWYYKDKGRFKAYAGGVALTPGNGRCVVVQGWIEVDGHRYSRTANDDHLPCN